MQCGIWDLFDPDIEGAAKGGCTQTKNVVRGEGYWKQFQKEQRDTLTSHLPSIAFTRSFEGRRSGLGFAPPRSALAARTSFETYRSLIVASRSSVKRHARTELTPHLSGTSTAASSLEYRVFTVPALYLSRNFFTTSPTFASSVIGVALVVNVFPLAARRIGRYSALPCFKRRREPPRSALLGTFQDVLCDR